MNATQREIHTSRPPTSAVRPETGLAELRRLQSEHPFWNNRLFGAFAAGYLDREALRYVFSQYQFYSKSFTRFLSALMANCENDLFRSRLSENLWEEGGGCAPENRHAEIFRRFLRESLGVDEPEATAYEAHTRHFVREMLVFCLRSEPAAASAFLSLGTEGIVPRMYTIFVEGMRRAGLSDAELEFFHMHISCDDRHAETLEDMMLSYSWQPGWFETCLGGMNHALDLRAQFFEGLMDGLERRRLDGLLRRIQARTSLIAPGTDATAFRHRPGDSAEVLYANRIEASSVDFTVDRVPLASEVLDPRLVRIPPGKCNELHRHAHETVMHFLEGSGLVRIDDKTLDVQAGDTVLVPRWSLHQTENSGASVLRFLAVTDFLLTDRALIGDAKAYRLNEAANAHRSTGAK